jgi:adenosylmethionine-8-amino-7-oxononanoate aminotransferase
LELLENDKGRGGVVKAMEEEAKGLWDLEMVGDVRQSGAVMGVELVRDWRTREAFRIEEKIGIRVCEAMAARGVLTRPIGNVIVIMPPFCATRKQVQKIFYALKESVKTLT